MRALILSLLVLFLNLNAENAEAIAVASDYLEDNTLTLIEGTSKIYRIQLQNPDSFEIKYKVDYDDQFMKAIDFKEEYILPPKSSISIEFNVTAPKYDTKNNIFAVSYTVHQLTGGDGGGIPFLTKINKNFKLKVARDPNKFYIYYDYAAYIAVVLAFLLYVFWKRRKTKKNKRKSKKFL